MVGSKRKTVDLIIEYEGGNPTFEEFFILFGRLIKSGQAWTLQGHYGRTAKGIIDKGYITKSGIVQWKKIKATGINLKGDIYGGQ